MAYTEKKFLEFLSNAAFFKGRSDLQYCFLKAEKVTQVCAALEKYAPAQARLELQQITAFSAKLPESIVLLASGELSLSEAQSDIFLLLSKIRYMRACNGISTSAADILVEEVCLLSEKLDAGMRISPFIDQQAFSVEESLFSKNHTPLRVSEDSRFKGHANGANKGHFSEPAELASSRSSRVLQIVKDKGKVSIKDVAAVITDCSEKTIQRELGDLVRKGHIEKSGERRWSVYAPILDLKR